MIQRLQEDIQMDTVHYKSLNPINLTSSGIYKNSMQIRCNIPKITAIIKISTFCRMIQENNSVLRQVIASAIVTEKKIPYVCMSNSESAP
jgi:hypothetical protein